GVWLCKESGPACSFCRARSRGTPPEQLPVTETYMAICSTTSSPPRSSSTFLRFSGSSCCDENGPMQNAPTRLSVIRSCPCSISLAPASFSPCSSSIKLQLPGRALSSCSAVCRFIFCGRDQPTQPPGPSKPNQTNDSWQIYSHENLSRSSWQKRRRSANTA